MRYATPDWDAALTVLQGARSVAIASHVNPDGDAVGSLLAASLGLRKLDKTTFASLGDSAVVPPVYEFLPAIDTLVAHADVEPTDVFLALDCGAAHRLGTLEEVATRSRCVVNVDHHQANENFGNLNLVVTTASSTSELVLGLLTDLGVELDRDIATCLYTGIVTDTGRFQYASTSPDVLRVAADLMSYGVPVTDIAQQVFESAPFAYLKLVGRMLDRASLVEEQRFVYSWITQDDLRATGVSMEETDKLVDLVRSIRDADIAAMVKEQSDGRFRVSLRSKGPRSVGAIARAKGGGGHELAAGFSADSVDEAIGHVRAMLGGA